MTTHQQSVHNQFNPQAQAYLDSSVHAKGKDLERACELIKQVIPQTGAGLDVGCGAGHLSYALSPLVSRMVALDMSEGMLDTVGEIARKKGLTNIETMQGNAEALPFHEETFCFVATRYSAHHWIEIDKAMKEMRRVLKRGGYVLIIDVETSMNPLVDTHFQTLELLHDRSHVRDRSETEWRKHVQDAGFEIIEYSHFPVRLEFSSWVGRIDTPLTKVEMIREIQSEAPIEVREALAIEEDGSFTIQTALIWARIGSTT